MNLLFAGPAASGILVHHRRVDDLALLDALLHPQVRLDVFFRLPLVCLDEMLEDLRVRVRQDDTRQLGACGRIATGVLPCSVSTRPPRTTSRNPRVHPAPYRSIQPTPSNQPTTLLSEMRRGENSP